MSVDWTDGDPLLTQCNESRLEIEEVVRRLRARVAVWVPSPCPPRRLQRKEGK